MHRSPIGLRAEVVFTSASWRPPQLASDCPTSAPKENSKLREVEQTAAPKPHNRVPYDLLVVAKRSKHRSTSQKRWIGRGKVRFGPVELIEFLLDGAFGTRIGHRMNTHLQQLGVAVGNDVCVGSKQVAKLRTRTTFAARRFTL
jgi:hypothetical protein